MRPQIPDGAAGASSAPDATQGNDAPADPGRPRPRYKRPPRTWAGKKRPHRKADSLEVKKALGEPAPAPPSPPSPEAAAKPATPAPASPPPAAAAKPAPDPEEEKRKIAAALEVVKSKRGLRTFTMVYRTPWALWQSRIRKKGCPLQIVPAYQELEEGGEALREIALMFPGAWVKFMPVMGLAVIAGKHYLQACDVIELWDRRVKWEKERRAAGRGLEASPATAAPPGNAPPPLPDWTVFPPGAPAQGPEAPRPPDAPPEVTATEDPSGAAPV